MLCDTGLLESQLALDADRLNEDMGLAGRALENFIAMELKKQLTWSDVQATLHHYRAHTQQEVDLLLEDPSGRIVGIEVKASASVDGDDFRGLQHLAELVGDRFVRGIMLYRGNKVVPFGKNMYALPVGAGWT